MVRHISDRVGVMYLGRLVESGPTEEVYLRPVHPYTQALLSAIPKRDPSQEKQRIHLEGRPQPRRPAQRLRLPRPLSPVHGYLPPAGPPGDRAGAGPQGAVPFGPRSVTKAPLLGKQGGFICRCDNELYHKYYFSSNIPRIASAAAWPKAR